MGIQGHSRSFSSCLVVPAFICIDLLISLVLKINDDDDDDEGHLLRCL